MQEHYTFWTDKKFIGWVSKQCEGVLRMSHMHNIECKSITHSEQKKYY